MGSRIAILLGTLAVALLVGMLFRLCLWEKALDHGDSSIRIEEPGRSGSDAKSSSVQFFDSSARQKIEPVAGDRGAERPPNSESSEVTENRVAYPFLVQGEDGEPIPGAIVKLFRRPFGQPIREETCSGSGAVTLQSPRPGDALEIEAPEYLTTRSTLEDRPWPCPYSIFLKRAKKLWEGLLVNDLELPVEGAEIIMFYDGGWGKGTTGRDGTFSLHFKEMPSLPMEVKFLITHPSHCFLGEDIPIEIESMDKKPTIRVHRWARLLVEVIDPEGRPLSDASAKLAGSPESANRKEIPCGAEVEVSLDLSEGEDKIEEGIPEPLLIEKVPPLLPLWLLAEHPGYETVEVELDTFDPAQERRIIVQFTRPSRNSEAVFKVVDPEGKPVKGAMVALCYDQGESTFRYERVVDEEGRFKFMPQSDEFEVNISAAGYAYYERAFISLDLGAETITLTLEPSDANVLVRVIDAEGGPVPQASITMKERGNKKFHKALWTDEEGRSVFSGLNVESAYIVHLGFGRPGSYFKKRDWIEVPSPAAYYGVRPGSPELVFCLVPPASIQGTVTIEGAAGKPVCLTLVDVTSVDNIFTLGIDLGFEGEFHFSGLPPGRYHLWMRSFERGGSLRRPLAVWDLGAGEKIRDAVVDGD